MNSKMNQKILRWLTVLLLLLPLASVTAVTPLLRHLQDDDDNNPCPCVGNRPPWQAKAATARWLVHAADYGVLATTSSLFDGVAFGNVYSYVDGPSCGNATGTPYMYGTLMDQSFQDLQQQARATLSVTEASLSCGADGETAACQLAQGGDPESPVCARVTLVGTVVRVEDAAEFASMQQGLLERHPQMAYWPANHDWQVVKLVVEEVWMLDYFGGATLLTPEEYFGATMDQVVVEPVD